MDYASDSVFPVDKTGRDSEIRNMFRHGKVTEVLCDETQVCVRVQYLDKDGLISKPLPVKQHGSRSTSAFYCPKVGDDVMVTMLPNGDEDGFVDGSFYNTGNPPPITDPNTRHITFADTTVIEYAEGPPPSLELGLARSAGQGTGTFTFSSNGPITITCGNCIIKAGTITLQADVHITGKLTVDGQSLLKGGGTATPRMTNSDGSGNGS